MEPVICPECGRRFETPATWSQHYDDSHNMEIQRVKCIYGCERLFRDEHAMLKHGDAKHADGVDEVIGGTSTVIPVQKKLPFVCAECGLYYHTLKQLHAHQTVAECKRPDRSHIWVADEPGSPTCEVCDKVCDDHLSLEQHFVSSHAVIQLRKHVKEKREQESKFLVSWKKQNKGDIRIQNVFKIYNSAWRVAGYERYRMEIDANSRGYGKSQGNELLLYHGTSLTCDLGSEKQGAKLCSGGKDRKCNMCSILRQGFKVSKADSHKWQRFGRGIYTTPHSGKSDDYIPPDADRRAVFVCNVLTGRQFETETSMPHLTAPPPGYDSVWGKPGQDLKYDEHVVYKSRAILPKYIIVYTKHPNVESRFLDNTRNTLTLVDGSVYLVNRRSGGSPPAQVIYQLTEPPPSRPRSSLELFLQQFLSL